MQIRSPRTILAVSAALALAVSALAPMAALAKGPGSADCDGDCTAEQQQVQQQTQAQDGSGTRGQQRTRTQDGSAQQTETQANAGGGRQVQARADNGKSTNQKQNANQKQGAGQGKDDANRGPGNCEDCDIEMGTLTAEQEDGLVFMANEEKLAEDVYTAFAELYDLRIFENIAKAEARHQVAVDTLLQRYGIENPVKAMADGQFSDVAIAALYTQLVEQGSSSLEEALAVGVLIEETDIADLIERLAGLEETAPDVHNMYSHLLTGSEHHLAAFQSLL